MSKKVSCNSQLVQFCEDTTSFRWGNYSRVTDFSSKLCAKWAATGMSFGQWMILHLAAISWEAEPKVKAHMFSDASHLVKGSSDVFDHLVQLRSAVISRLMCDIHGHVGALRSLCEVPHHWVDNTQLWLLSTHWLTSHRNLVHQISPDFIVNL